MTHTSSHLLEFDLLKQVLARYVAGPLGRAHVERVAPSSDRAIVEPALAELAEAIEHQRQASKLPLGGITDVSAAVEKLRIEGAGLEASEIAQVSTMLERATSVRQLLLEEEKSFPRLAAIARGIGLFRDLLRDIGGKILANGSVADDASVALSRLRRDMEKQRKQIQSSLDRFVRAHREEGVLQEEYITLRNDRFVVPIIVGQKRRVEGVIHGASGSGQTLFIEPLETIDLNNELVRLVEEELREVHRILREITARLRSQAPAIRETLEIVGRIDLLFAKAAFAADFGCVIPRFSPADDRRLLLKRARHPLLEDVLRRQKGHVIPTSLTLDREQRILLVSGPNTGGKTVAMKTVGLLALMAHSGLAVPAEDAEFPLFDQVLADIGDQQSIQESLSTFSAHITCIREMILDATPESLVLLDELGRATDPEEGGALGVAILEHFRTLRAFTVASTHLLALKIYGANTQAVLNGSMGFDDQTLAPTYVLQLGAPGKSAGLDVAARLGLPAYLIERARAAMSTAERDIARFLDELHQRIESAHVLEADLRRRIAEVEARATALDREHERREVARVRDLEEKFAALAARFETQASETIQGLYQSAEQRKAAEQAQRRVAKAKRELREQFETSIKEAAPAPQTRGPQIQEGSRVILKGIRQPARIRRILSGGLLEVDAGLMKMQVSREDIEEVLDGGAETPALPRNVAFRQGPRWDVPFQEINIIGRRGDEAADEVDKFLDRAALAGVQRVRIVHGHGMGVLKRTVAELLKHSPHVEKFYAASQSEGGEGATIAELKAD